MAPGNSRLYAIGDIHGRSDLVKQIIGLIQDDNRSRDEAAATILFVGDYVDRGPCSKEVVDYLTGELPEGFSPLFLKGNHEEMMLTALKQPLSALNWLHNGGDATLFSYGVTMDVVQRALWGGPEGLEEAAAALRALMPERHLRFYEELKPCYRWGGYFFTHAGVRPGVALDRQSEEDLLWIREEFLSWPDDFGAIVVHGHTPMRTPQNLPNRIGIDTYAVHTGKLTAVGLQDTRRWFLST